VSTAVTHVLTCLLARARARATRSLLIARGSRESCRRSIVGAARTLLSRNGDPRSASPRRGLDRALPLAHRCFRASCSATLFQDESLDEHAARIQVSAASVATPCTVVNPVRGTRVRTSVRHPSTCPYRRMNHVTFLAKSLSIHLFSLAIASDEPRAVRSSRARDRERNLNSREALNLFNNSCGFNPLTSQ